jgi:DNA adenine methylase
MADWISSYVPEDIETYIEVFGGAFWVYVNSDIYQRPNLKKVIYNDWNPYMVNLFRCASNPKAFDNFIDSKNVPAQMKGQPELSSECLAFFEQCKEDLFGSDAAIKYLRSVLADKTIIKKARKNLNEVLRTARDLRSKENEELSGLFREKVRSGTKNQAVAMKYAYIVTCSFSGIDPADAEFQDYKGKYNSKFVAFRNRLSSEKFVPKLKKIEMCENLDFEELIKKYDSPTTYFYCDPPYWQTENYYSLHQFGRDDHWRLAKTLIEMEGRFSLSYYDFDDLSIWFPKNEYKWEVKEFVKPAGAKEGVDQGIGEELLIMNY